MSETFTWHGGGLEAARRTFGDGADWIDLSTGINPHAWPKAGSLAIDWHRLPEREDLAALEHAAAQMFGASPRHVCAVPGTEIGLRLIGQIIGGPGQYLTPNYSTHAQMLPDAQPVHASLLHGSGETLILANPNNPDGRLLSRDVLTRVVAQRDPGCWLLLDEAFADTQNAESLAAHVSDDRRLIVFRSFGKFFGLAGVRLGFVIAPVPVLERLRRWLGAWPVSAAAIAIGIAAYRDAEWIETTRVTLRTDAEKLDHILQDAGYEPRGACPLFRLIETPDARAQFERLAARHILTRPFADREDWLRLGLPSCPDAFKRLAAALRDG